VALRSSAMGIRLPENETRPPIRRTADTHRFGYNSARRGLTGLLRFPLGRITLRRRRLAADNQELLAIRRVSSSRVGPQRVLAGQKQRRFVRVHSSRVKLDSPAALARPLAEQNA